MAHAEHTVKVLPGGTQKVEAISEVSSKPDISYDWELYLDGAWFNFKENIFTDVCFKVYHYYILCVCSVLIDKQKYHFETDTTSEAISLHFALAHVSISITYLGGNNLRYQQQFSFFFFVFKFPP